MIKYDGFKSYHKEQEATGNLQQWSHLSQAGGSIKSFCINSKLLKVCVVLVLPISVDIPARILSKCPYYNTFSAWSLIYHWLGTPRGKTD